MMLVPVGQIKHPTGRGIVRVRKIANPTGRMLVIENACGDTPPPPCAARKCTRISSYLKFNFNMDTTLRERKAHVDTPTHVRRELVYIPANKIPEIDEGFTDIEEICNNIDAYCIG